MSLVLLFGGGGGGQTVAIGQATETDTAQAVSWVPKVRLVNQTTETDAAQTITPDLVETVAFDAVTFDPPTGINAGTHSFTHTPVGTPAGVIILVADSDDTDQVTTVTYGGDTVFEVSASPQVQSGGSEFGSVHGFFLGTSIPTGAQTVTVTRSGISNGSKCVCITLTAPSDLQVIDSDGLTATSGADPTLSLTTDRKTFVAGAIWSGQNAITGISAGSGQTTIVEQDFGADVGGFSYLTAIQDPGGFAYDWTMATEEHALLVLAVGEAVSVVPIDIAEETDSAFRLATVANRANESDVAQVVAAVLGSYTLIGQAEETDLAQPIALRQSLQIVGELDRAKQVTVVGGLFPIADAPVLVRAPRKAGRIFHEFTSPSGDGFHPTVGEWSSEEEAPGGFMGATGQISRSTFHSHREVFRPGCLWRTFLEDGTCLFAGRLKSPDPDGSIVTLAAEGRAHIADKVIGPILYQAAIGSEISTFQHASERWGVSTTTMQSTYHDTGLQFQRSANQPSGNAEILVPFFGRDVAFLRMHMQGQSGQLVVKTSVRNRLPNPDNSAELDVDGVVYENYYFNFATSQTAENVAIDLTLGSGLLPNPNQTEFTNVGNPTDTGWGHIWPNLLIFEVSDWGSTPSNSEHDIILSNIEVNGSPLGSSRRFGVGDLVEDVAARLGFHSVHFGGAYDITPYELPPGGTAAEALDMASLLSGKRWRILDTGARASFEFGWYREHSWALASPWSPLRTIPEERFDAVAVPYQYPGTHGQLTDQVVVRVEDSPFVVKRVAWDVGLSQPSHNRDKAIDLGALLADWLVRPRYSGDFSAAEVTGPDGEKISAHHVNAGDILRPWRNGEPGALRIGRLTRFEDRVEGEFDGESKTLTRIMERRAKRIADRKN